MSDVETTPVPRRRFPAYVTGILFLVCGLIIGSGSTLLLIQTAVHKMIAQPEILPARILDRMEYRLSLKPEQRTAIEQIVEKRMAAFEAIRRRVSPEIQTELDRLRNEVSDVLDPEQKAQWELQFDKIRQRWQPGTQRTENKAH